MISSVFPSLAVLAALASPAAAQTFAPRDLSGVWTTASWTQLQRPKAASGLVITEAEGRKLHAEGLARATAGDELGQMTTEYPEMGDGYAVIHGQIRSSWLVEPADGRLPYTDTAKKRVEAWNNADGLQADYSNVEARPTGERCLTADGAGAPILNSPDTNLVTLVLTPDALALVSEKNHDLRVVRIGAAAPGSQAPTGWFGDTVGHWEGAALVAETQRLRPGETFVTDNLPLSGEARITERFTRTGPDEIEYDFAVTDPVNYTRPWRGEMVFHRSKAPMFEYACHEGNYSLPGILAGGLKMQADAARTPAKSK